MMVHGGLSRRPWASLTAALLVLVVLTHGDASPTTAAADALLQPPPQSPLSTDAPPTVCQHSASGTYATTIRTATETQGGTDRQPNSTVLLLGSTFKVLACSAQAGGAAFVLTAQLRGLESPPGVALPLSALGSGACTMAALLPLLSATFTQALNGTVLTASLLVQPISAAVWSAHVLTCPSGWEEDLASATVLLSILAAQLDTSLATASRQDEVVGQTSWGGGAPQVVPFAMHALVDVRHSAGHAHHTSTHFLVPTHQTVTALRGSVPDMGAGMSKTQVYHVASGALQSHVATHITELPTDNGEGDLVILRTTITIKMQLECSTSATQPPVPLPLKASSASTLAAERESFASIAAVTTAAAAAAAAAADKDGVTLDQLYSAAAGSRGWHAYVQDVKEDLQSSFQRAAAAVSAVPPPSPAAAGGAQRRRLAGAPPQSWPSAGTKQQLYQHAASTMDTAAYTSGSYTPDKTSGSFISSGLGFNLQAQAGATISGTVVEMGFSTGIVANFFGTNYTLASYAVDVSIDLATHAATSSNQLVAVGTTLINAQHTWTLDDDTLLDAANVSKVTDPTQGRWQTDSTSATLFQVDLPLFSLATITFALQGSLSLGVTAALATVQAHEVLILSGAVAGSLRASAALSTPKALAGLASASITATVDLCDPTAVASFLWGTSSLLAGGALTPAGTYFGLSVSGLGVDISATGTFLGFSSTTSFWHLQSSVLFSTASDWSCSTDKTMQCYLDTDGTPLGASNFPTSPPPPPPPPSPPPPPPDTTANIVFDFKSMDFSVITDPNEMSLFKLRLSLLVAAYMSMDSYGVTVLSAVAGSVVATVQITSSSNSSASAAAHAQRVASLVASPVAALGGSSNFTSYYGITGVSAVNPDAPLPAADVARGGGGGIGVIVGAAVGGLAGLALAVAATVVLVRRRRRSLSTAPLPSSAAPHEEAIGGTVAAAPPVIRAAAGDKTATHESPRRPANIGSGEEQAGWTEVTKF